jgi:hypothetical protein
MFERQSSFFRQALAYAEAQTLSEQRALDEYKELVELERDEYINLAKYQNKISRLSRFKFFTALRIKQLEKKESQCNERLNQLELKLDALEETEVIATIINREIYRQ